ncbi:hypothetical protein BT67DRAFT_52603 [Trichocladium antarcticum]|uniref:Uncharacterized protein n=1 Tax=Trichocladium antarcticum TaxID=1450529 RepID=A0AAN6ZCS5_9PEZI|nr:hypothetical protein BT67DRAFT_52603 [Trichocladium antarcticum]
MSGIAATGPALSRPPGRWLVAARLHGHGGALDDRFAWPTASAHARRHGGAYTSSFPPTSRAGVSIVLLLQACTLGHVMGIPPLRPRTPLAFCFVLDTRQLFWVRTSTGCICWGRSRRSTSISTEGCRLFSTTANAVGLWGGNVEEGAKRDATFRSFLLLLNQSQQNQTAVTANLRGIQGLLPRRLVT